MSSEALNPNQSGFRSGDWTVHQLIFIIYTIFHAFDCSTALDVRSAYLDISKVYDRVWHDGLIFKLQQYCFAHEILSVIGHVGV